MRELCDVGRFPQQPILIVDDDRDGTLISSAVLRISGFPSDVVSSGAEALLATRKKAYAAIILDYDMPSMNGLQLAQRLRQEGCDSALVMFSGRLSPPHEAGAELLSAFISKGQGPTTLIETVRKILLARISPEQLPLSLSAGI